MSTEIKKLVASYQFDGGRGSYAVGDRGITKIEPYEFSPEPFCSRVAYKVFQGTELFAEVYDSVVGEVIYGSPQPTPCSMQD